MGVEAQRKESVQCRGTAHSKPCHMAGWTADNVCSAGLVSTEETKREASATFNKYRVKWSPSSLHSNLNFILKDKMTFQNHKSAQNFFSYINSITIIG